MSNLATDTAYFTQLSGQRPKFAKIHPIHAFLTYVYKNSDFFSQVRRQISISDVPTKTRFFPHLILHSTELALFSMIYLFVFEDDENLRKPVQHGFVGARAFFCSHLPKFPPFSTKFLGGEGNLTPLKKGPNIGERKVKNLVHQTL